MNDEILKILQICCDKFNVTIDDVRGNSTRLEISYCRKAFAKAIETRFPVSHQTIGEYLSKKRAAVGYMINNDIIDAKFKRTFSEICQLIDNESTTKGNMPH